MTGISPRLRAMPGMKSIAACFRPERLRDTWQAYLWWSDPNRPPPNVVSYGGEDANRAWGIHFSLLDAIEAIGIPELSGSQVRALTAWRTRMFAMADWLALASLIPERGAYCEGDSHAAARKAAMAWVRANRPEWLGPLRADEAHAVARVLIGGEEVERAQKAHEHIIAFLQREGVERDRAMHWLAPIRSDAWVALSRELFASRLPHYGEAADAAKMRAWCATNLRPYRDCIRPAGEP